MSGHESVIVKDYAKVSENYYVGNKFGQFVEEIYMCCDVHTTWIELFTPKNKYLGESCIPFSTVSS